MLIVIVERFADAAVPAFGDGAGDGLEGACAGTVEEPALHADAARPSTALAASTLNVIDSHPMGEALRASTCDNGLATLIPIGGQARMFRTCKARAQRNVLGRGKLTHRGRRPSLSLPLPRIRENAEFSCRTYVRVLQ
jgi:hypothetical protein